MKPTPLLDALHQVPFRPFVIHADGRAIPVDHPEQVFVTPSKTTLVVASPEDSIWIVDVDHISSIGLKPRRGKTSKT